MKKLNGQDVCRVKKLLSYHSLFKLLRNFSLQSQAIVLDNTVLTKMFKPLPLYLVNLTLTIADPHHPLSLDSLMEFCV